MKNNKGFTLIELLATITLLAVLMLIAVPNIIGVVNRNKNSTYVEDAKKLVALAEYKIRSDSSYKPTSSKKICLYMSFLGMEDFDTTAPNGGTYDASKSYVQATKNSSGVISYKVVLAEVKDGKYHGITTVINSTELYKDNASSNVKTATSISDCSGTKYK